MSDVTPSTPTGQLRLRFTEALGRCPTCGRPGRSMTEAAKQIGMSRTALYRFLDGAPIHSDHFDAISAWIERQPQ